MREEEEFIVECCDVCWRWIERCVVVERKLLWILSTYTFVAWAMIVGRCIESARRRKYLWSNTRWILSSHSFQKL